MDEKERKRPQMEFPKPGRLLWGLLLLLYFASPLRAEDDDLRTLELYNAGQVEVLGVDRSPRPASQTAENITVVTAEDIRALNAHTLTELLYTVSGIQIQNSRTPGSVVYLAIEGSNYNHILVLIDNVPINILTENWADVGSIPVQIIERVEIVKGAASSSWGSALGGVINVITKSPQADRPVAAVLSGSYGSRETLDGRAEVSGSIDRFGYYLTGGKLRSDGLVQHNSVDLDSLYWKFTYDLPTHGSLTFTAGLTSNESGHFGVSTEFPTPAGPLPYSATSDSDVTHLISSLSLQYPLMDRLELWASLHGRDSEVSTLDKNSFSPDPIRAKTDESSIGGSLMLSWVGSKQRIAAGVDYDYVQAELSGSRIPGDSTEPDAHRVGVYLNDTVTLGAFAITPSARFDHPGTGSNLFSPSLGLTYAVTENSVLRGYAARGYSITSINRDNMTEKVWTAQVGFETADIPYLWLKGTVFHNDTWHIAVPVQAPTGEVSLAFQREVKQGYELEIKTTPVFDTSLSLAYTFLDGQNETTDTVLRDVARHTLKVGLKYENPAYLRALLFGTYVDWNGDGGPYDGDYSSMIWDLHLGKEFKVGPTTSVEIFSSIRNLFNGSQILFPYSYPNRWAEVGVRCAF